MGCWFLSCGLACSCCGASSFLSLGNAPVPPHATDKARPQASPPLFVPALSLHSTLLATPLLPPADEEGPTLGRAAAAGGAVVERVAKDLSSLTREQRLAAVQQDAPELLQVGWAAC